jgi:hypothetical protein
MLPVDREEVVLELGVESRVGSIEELVVDLAMEDVPVLVDAAKAGGVEIERPLLRSIALALRVASASVELRIGFSPSKSSAQHTYGWPTATLQRSTELRQHHLPVISSAGASAGHSS